MSPRSDNLTDQLCCTLSVARDIARILAMSLLALMLNLGFADRKEVFADEFRLPDDRPVLDRDKLESSDSGHGCSIGRGSGSASIGRRSFR